MTRDDENLNQYISIIITNFALTIEDRPSQ